MADARTRTVLTVWLARVYNQRPPNHHQVCAGSGAVLNGPGLQNSYLHARMLQFNRWLATAPSSAAQERAGGERRTYCRHEVLAVHVRTQKN